MKLPSIVKIAKNQRFNITPRHYDPIKEEIEQRTSAIKKELQDQGVISSERSLSNDYSGYQSSMRGAFKAKSQIKSSSIFEKTGLLRIFILVLLLGGLGGYLYLGPDVLYYIFYLCIGIGMVIILKRLKRRNKNE